MLGYILIFTAQLKFYLKNTMKRTLTLFLFLLALSHSYAQSVPELLYYKFDGSGTTVPNLALTPPAGTATATIIGGQAQGGNGQCSGALIGNGLSSTSNYVNTNWATNLDGTSWTLSFWTNNVPSTTSTQYILGDVNAGGFRVFTGGVAGAGNWILRGGFTDVLATGGASTGPSLTTFVYDMPANEIRAYVNGVLVSTVAQTTVSINGPGPFKVGAYSGSASLPAASLMDEFRLYNRALTVPEIAGLMITSTSSTASITACNSYTVPSGDETYTAGGSYMDTIPNMAGCDSIMTINLTIINSSASMQSVTTCNSYTVPSGNQSYTVSGTYMDTIPNMAGCDSVMTINLTILNSTANTQSVTACNSYTVPSGNQSYTASGTYMDTIPNMAGCDSVMTINLIIINSSASMQTITSCNSYTVPGGQVYTMSGTYMDTIPNMAGCDSVMTFNLTITNSSASTQSVNACYSYTVPSGNQTYTMSGTYMDTIPNMAGCDSIMTINLTIDTVNTGVTVSASGVTLTANAVGAGYQWIDCSSNMPLAGETAQSFMATADGMYAVVVTENLCTDTSACFTIVGTGVNENHLASRISLYPNPTQGQFTIISSDKQEKLLVEIVNILGETVQSEMITGAQPKSFNIEGTAGMYFVKISNGAGEKTMIKVIRQ
ncbi:MAG: hypothetical protein JWO09_2302 [Bacteroidetes bacterium]|nr:hypothetical protein [Bacteroidota bacterium]